MVMVDESKLGRPLIGKGAIQKYIESLSAEGEKCSDHAFYQYIEIGMPALFHARKWYAHTRNIDVFFEGLTRVSMKSNLDKIKTEEGA